MSVALALIILVSSFTFSVYAEGSDNAEEITGDASDVIASGYCGAEGDGKNLSWKLTGDGKLTISGNGKMKNYVNATESNAAPWCHIYDKSKDKIISYNDMVTSVEFIGNITSIGDDAFSHLKISTIEIPNSVTSIGRFAFQDCENLTSITIPASVTTVDELIFCVCDKLSDIYCEAKSQPSGWNADWNKNSWLLNDSTIIAATVHWGWKPAANDTSSKSDNPKTGFALSVIPMVLALVAVSFKKR